MKIIDAHCHIYPDYIAEKASKAIGAFYDYSMHADGKLDTLIRMSDAAGITNSVVSAVATTAHQVPAVNRFLSDVVRTNSGRFIGLGAIHPDCESPEDTVNEIISLGLSGVKIHPDFIHTPLDDPRLLRFFELLEGRLPVLCHLGDYRYDSSSPERVKRVLRDFPELVMIGAHLGGWTVWEQAADVLCRCENLVVDCSSSLFAVTPEEGARLIRLYGADRVMFGTDYPMWDPAEEVPRFFKLPLTAEEQEKILYRNAAALFLNEKKNPSGRAD